MYLRNRQLKKNLEPLTKEIRIKYIEPLFHILKILN